MWTRARIKEEARKGLRDHGYWTPLLVTVVAGLLGGNAVRGIGNTGRLTAEYGEEFTESLTPTGLYAALEALLEELGAAVDGFFTNPLIAMTTAFVFMASLIVGLVIAFGWDAFVVGPIIVGKNRYFMERRGFESKFDRLFWAYKSGRYLNIVKIMFWRDLKIFFWSLLFVIPGIIKAYEYSMIPYILAENPDISSERAFLISKKMTMGEKWKIFVLNLSFIGWRILGALLCCVGEIFLEPYYEATMAELYQVMREKAHGTGISNYVELGGFFPDQT